jgi:hypothetical protein
MSGRWSTWRSLGSLCHLTLTVEVPQWSSMDERKVADLTEFLQGAIERANAAEKILENAQPLKD